MKAEIKITEIPQALYGMRLELADMLREMALDERPDVGQRLRQIAAAFEAGAHEWRT